MSKIVKFHLSNQEFVIFVNDLEKHINSLLYKIINNDVESSLFYKENDIIYINRNPEYFKYIVTYLRNELYMEDINELSTKDAEQLYNESVFYNFPVLTNILENKKMVNGTLDNLIDVSNMPNNRQYYENVISII